MAYASPVAVRPRAGSMGTPAAFAPISDPMPFFGGGYDLLRGGSCGAGGCCSPPPGGGPSPSQPSPSQPSGSPSPPPGGGGGGAPPVGPPIGGPPTGPSSPPSPSPSPSPGSPDEAEDYGLSQVGEFYGRAASGSMIDPARGNIMTQYATPAGGPLDPVVVLTFNEAYRGNSDEYPDGWTSNVKRRIDDTASPDVDVVSGSGTAYRYTSGATADYDAPDTTPNWLADDSGTGGWIETQPDGLRYYYDSGGKLTKMENHVGKLWTLTYVSGTSRVSSIENPANKLTTFHYDANDELQAIEDFANRRTTLTVSSNQLTKITSPELCETEFSYDANDRLQARISPGGGRTTYSYDGSGRVQNVTFPGSGKTTYSYSGNDTIFTDPRGKVSTFQHTAAKLLDVIVDPTGKRTSLTWSGSLLRSVENPLGQITTFSHKTFTNYGTSMLEKVESPLADVGTLAYDTTSPSDGIPPRLDAIEYPDGKRTTLHWAASTNLEVASLEDPLNHRSSFSYDATGMVTDAGDALGNTYTYEYDSQGRTEAMVDPLSERTTYTYNANNQVETVKNPLGNVWTFTRDDLNRVTTAVDPLAGRTTTTYGSNCLVETVKNPLGKVTTYTYTSRDQLEAVEDPLGHITTFSYDDAGNLESIENPLGKLTTSVYDDAERLSATVNPLGHRTSYTYDDAGQLTEVEDPLGNVSTTVYDDAGRVEASVNAEGERTTFTYDANGRITEVENALNNVTTNVYDGAGRLTDIVDALGRTMTYEYDDANRATVRIDRKGRRTTFAYDDVGRQTSRQYQNGTRVTQTYDAAGQRTVLWDSTGRTTTTYDDAGQVTSVKNPANKTIQYSYYDDGLRKTTTEPGGGLFTYTYDDASQMTEIENPQNERTTFEYDLAGRRLKIERDNGIDTTLAYDDASQLKGITHRKTSTGATIMSYDYTYNSAGIRTQVAEHGGVTTSWGYDNAYRLTSEKREDAGGVLYRDTFTYDDVGNRTLLHNAAGRTTYTYDAANQLETAVLGATRTTYTYDDNGNLEVERTGSDRTTHTWDDENRLTKVELPGGTPVDNEYTFNGDGQRVEIVDSQGTKKPIWDVENILLETDGSNATQVIYTLEPQVYGNLLSQRRGSTTSFYLFDALGSSRKLVNTSGTVTDSYDYRAYGETYASSGSTVNVFRWVGELGYYYDIDRLAYYLRARAYSPKLARFLSQDPIGYDSNKWNLYEYVSNRPLMEADPSGRAGYWQCVAMNLEWEVKFAGCACFIGGGGYGCAQICLTGNAPLCATCLNAIYMNIPRVCQGFVDAFKEACEAGCTPCTSN